MSTAPLYDQLGRGYADKRRPDPRIAAQLEAALGDADDVVNVGAGAGSYEPRARRVVAVEPSPVMIAQRAPAAVPAVQAVAEHLPFPDDSFDAALAVLTVHHWNDPSRGLAELRRVARRQIVLTWDPSFLAAFWFTRDYLPEAEELDKGFADFDTTLAALSPTRVEKVPVPHDCHDGFYAAYWRRPAAYLDPAVRAAISGFSLLDAGVTDPALEHLAADLESGAWHRRNAALMELDELDLGYRLVVAGAGDDAGS
jgi:SAM-dependent methyltransferase